MNRQFLPFVFCLIVFGSLCAFVAKSYANDRECTVTVKDHQGVYHVLKGMADE